MPREGGPIARMLYEHQIIKNLAESILNLLKIIFLMEIIKI
jgi:hemerythrin-like domain-containing protein